MHRTKNIKTACILALFLGVVGFACSNGNINQSRAQINFQETLHDFGTVYLNEEVSHDFAFTNPGGEILLIQNIKTSCGCTVPEWPTKPIKNRDKGNIHIMFDADFPGTFRKTITVYYNGENSPDTLFIKGEVEREKATS